MSEHQIQSAILEYLKLKHVLAYRMNTGGFGGSYKGKKWWVRVGAKGMADILIIRTRRCIDHRLPENNVPNHSILEVIWCEVKSPTGKQSEDQKAFQQEVEEAGCRYLIARCLEDVMGHF